MKHLWMIGLSGTFVTALSLSFFIDLGSIKEPASIFRTTTDGRVIELGTPQVSQTQNKDETQVLLNDPKMNKNWGLIEGDTNIKASKAWSITQGSRDVVVAIIDTGIDTNHPDLKNNLWKNPGECGNGKENNFKDDDGNGYIDDCHGFNFIKGHGRDLVDNHGHGTHIAGIVGAEGGNGVGISGVAPKVSLMVLKYFDPDTKGSDNLRNTIKAIHYAREMKADIINYSGGGLDFSKDEYQAVKLAQESGILFVAAAGNERSNSDSRPYYPANYDLDNIISVTAVNPTGHVLSSSNFGERTVHLGAPGENIYSTLPRGQYGRMTGTSQATAFVSGVAALIRSNNKEFNYKMIRKQIIATVDESPTLWGKNETSGILNSWAALAIQPQIPASGLVLSSNTPLQPETQQQTLGIQNQIDQLGGILNFLRRPARRNQ